MAQSLAEIYRRRSPTSKVTELRHLGDPIEVAALSQAFRASTDTKASAPSVPSSLILVIWTPPLGWRA